MFINVYFESESTSRAACWKMLRLKTVLIQSKSIEKYIKKWFLLYYLLKPVIQQRPSTAAKYCFLRHWQTVPT